MLQKLNRTTTGKPNNYPVKILQFGKGNFLRAFTGWMVDILNEKVGFNGSIQIIQTSSIETDDRFAAQDGLYHVVLNGIRHGEPFREIRLITCVKGVVNPYEDYTSYLQTGENPDLLFIVSNTTEAGVYFDPADAGPGVPSKSFAGKLTALLFHRYKFFQGDTRKAVTILPCELTEKNGEILRTTILQYISHWKLDEGFKSWIAGHTLFCDTLVDRIVPGFPKDTFREAWEETGYEDKLMVTAEPYHLWVIKPLPVAGVRPDTLRTDLPLEQAGLQVRFVSDLTPYRDSKVRILNGAHTSMLPVAYLLGLRTVKEAIDHPFTGNFIRFMLAEEIIPTLDLPEEELHRFAGDVIERFQNPYIRHELLSIALNSISKFQVRVLPSLLQYVHRKGELPQSIVHSLSALILFYKGEWKGQVIPLNDTPEVLSFFKNAWNRENLPAVVEQVLAAESIWKTDLTKIPGLAKEVERHMSALTETTVG